jgi:translation initiation factor IF-3
LVAADRVPRRTRSGSAPPQARQPFDSFLGEHSIATERTHRLNGEITAPEVRLVGIENEPLGIVRLGEARRMAEEANVDLVEIAPTAVPPVCRLMDYGKFRYQEQKRANEAKAKQKIVQIKEVKFRPATDEGDYAIKLRNMLNFLGREMAHQEFGVRLLERVRQDIDEIAVVESFPRMEGRQMVMMVAPRKKK